MCFMDGFNQNIARSQMKDNVLFNIQIIKCKPDEICNPTTPDSEYYGFGLGYVFFYCTCAIITCSFYIFSTQISDSSLLKFI